MQTTTLTKRLPATRTSVAWNSLVLNVGLISLGCLIYTLGMNSVLLPHQWLTGGITGFALILHYWVPSLDLGLMYLLMNIPLLILGWFHISRRFMWYTTFGMVLFSVMASRIRPPVAEIHDPMLAVVFAGVICGIGGGLILRSLGSAGGFDVLGVYLHKRFGLRPGGVIFLANSLPLMVGAYLFGLEKTLYSLACLFISSRVIDAVLTGFNQRKSIMIVSDNSQAIAQQILRGIRRGATVLKGEGAYTGRDREVIFTITTLTELPKLKELIFTIDPNAFVVINDTLEVLGKRHGKLKIY